MILVTWKCVNQILSVNCNDAVLQDHGVETLTNLIKTSNYPWLLSNVLDSVTKQPLAGALTKYILEFEGIKVSIKYWN